MLRPIDVTMTIQGSAEAQRAGLQGSQAGRPEVASQMFADRLHKQVREQEQQVSQTEQTEQSNVNPDGRGHGGGYQSKRKDKKTGTGKDSKSPKPTGESLYDIKI